MNKLLIALTLSAMGFSVQASAAESSSLYVIKSTNINASAATTWNKLARFGDLGAWHPAAKKTEIVSGAEGKTGARRVITLPDGGTVSEELTAYDENNKSMSYIITDGVLPVTAYASTLHVYPNGADKSVVVWEGRFQAKSEFDDKTASDTVSGVYDSGLSNLKKILE